MKPSHAVEILRTLADGIDLVTGEQFPPNSPYQQADTVRALYVAMEAMEKATPARTPRAADPTKPKVGTAWKPEEEKQLRDAFAAHKPITDIAAAHGRTRGAITARLVKLGLLDPGSADHPGMPRHSTPGVRPASTSEPVPPPPPATAASDLDICPF